MSEADRVGRAGGQEVTVPGGVPNLPVGALTVDTLASKTQDMSTGAMKSRAVERFPSTFDGSTGLSPASDLTPFGVLTGLFAGFNSTVANADPADVQGPEDLPDLLIQFIEGLPVIGKFVELFDAILGDYDGDDEILSAISEVFAPIRKLLQLITGIGEGDGFPTPAQITDGFADIPVLSDIVEWITGVAGGDGNDLSDWAAEIDDAAADAIEGLQDLASGLLSNPGSLLGDLSIGKITGLTAQLTALNDFIQGVVDAIISVLRGIPFVGGGIADLVEDIAQLKTTANQSTQIIDDIEAGWTGGTPTGTPTGVLDTIGAIRSALVGDYNVDVITSSTTWHKPSNLVEIHAAVCNGGGRGHQGNDVGGSGNTAEGGAGGVGGGWLVQELNPDDIASTVSVTVGAGQSVTNGANGGVSSFGSHVVGVAGEGGIGQPWGYIETASLPGNGGKGGSVSGTSTGAQVSSPGDSSPLASGGAGVAGISSGSNGIGNTGTAGAAASTTGPSKAGGGGGSGGGSRYYDSISSSGTTVGGTGGTGGFPGGGGGGGGAAGRGLAAGPRQGGAGGNGANGVVIVFWKGTA